MGLWLVLRPCVPGTSRSGPSHHRGAPARRTAARRSARLAMLIVDSHDPRLRCSPRWASVAATRRRRGLRRDGAIAAAFAFPRPLPALWGLMTSPEAHQLYALRDHRGDPRAVLLVIAYA